MIKLVITYLNDQNKTEVLISVVWKNSRRFVFVLRKKSPANKTAYLKQSNYCVFILQKVNVITMKILTIKILWIISNFGKLLLSVCFLIKSSEKIMLVEVAKMFCKMLQNAEILDTFFQTQLKTCRFQGLRS